MTLLLKDGDAFITLKKKDKKKKLKAQQVMLHSLKTN